MFNLKRFTNFLIFFLIISAQSLYPIGAPETMDTQWSFPVPVNSVNLIASSKGKTIKVVKTRSYSWGSTYNIVDSQKNVLAKVRMFSENQNLVAEIEAVVKGTYSYGVSLKGNNVRLLDSVYSEVGSNSAFYYPYNPNSTVQKNGGNRPSNGEISRGEFNKKGVLFIPGVILDKKVIANGDTSLYRVLVKGSTANKVVTFMRQKEIGLGRDTLTENITLNEGEKDFIKLVSSDSVKKIQTKKFGASKQINGTFVQIPFRGWGSSAEGEYLSNEVFSQMADTFSKSGVNHVQIRLNEPKAEIAQIFKNKGLTTHYYIFLGVARKRIINNESCYSLIGRNGPICVNDWLIKNSSNSGYYTPGNDSWALVDIRNPQYRAFLVDQAVYAIENGYEGIFYDGPQLWVDSKGRVGGRNTSYNISWYNARALLLKETKEAIRQKNSNAYLGILGNSYVDYQAKADYVLDEVVSWKEYTDKPSTRKFVYDPSLLDETLTKSKKVANNFVLGIKGNSASQVVSMQKVAKSKGIPVTAKYVDIGDFKAPYALEWLDVTAKVAKALSGN